MSDSGSEIGAFMAGFVIGGLVGAATALIMAPQSGEETRAQIAAKGEEIRLASEQQFADARLRVSESSSQVQEQARIVLDEGKIKVTEALDKSKERVAKSKDDIASEALVDDAELGDEAA